MWSPPFVDPTRIDRALRSAHTMTARVELYSNGKLVSESVPFSGGAVTDALGSNNQGIGVRRSLTLTAEPTPAWLRWLDMPGLEVRPFRGLWLGKSTHVECPLGRFPIRMPVRARPVTALSWNVDDYYSRIQDATFSDPIMSPDGGRITDFLSWLFTHVLGLPTPEVTATSEAQSVSILLNGSRHDAVVSAATSIAAEVFMDRFGIPQITDSRLVNDNTDCDITGLVEKLKRDQDWGAVYNVVSAYSSAQGVDFPAQRVAVMDPLNPSYPTRLGSLGYPDYRVYRFTSPQLTTATQAQAAALTLLAKVSALGETYTYDCIPDPRIDAGDMIIAPTLDGDKGLQVASVTHPLTQDGRQQITTIAAAAGLGTLHHLDTDSMDVF